MHTYLTHTHTRSTRSHMHIYICIVVISYKGEAITACTCLANGRVLSSKKNFSFYSRPPRGPVVLSSLLQQFFSSISAVCSISFHFGLSYLYSLFFPGEKKKREKIRPSRQITFDTGKGGKSLFFFSHTNMASENKLCPTVILSLDAT